MQGVAPPGDRPVATGPRERTIVLTDVEGSTVIWEREAEAGPAIARHEALIEAAVADAGGQLIRHKGEGDSTFSVFDDASAAVAAAVALQRALHAEPWPTAIPIRVRVGIDTGTVEGRDGDFYGRAPNRAARVRGIGAGGTIIATTSTVERLAGPLPDGTGLMDLGEHSLRGLDGLVGLVAVVHPELPDPSPALVHVRRRAAPPVPAALRRDPDAALVGRHRELDVLSSAWKAAKQGRASVALVAGEPGVGKTTLLAALAERVADDGGLVLHGRCDEERLRPYQPFAEALADAVGRLSGDELLHLLGTSAGDLAVVVPDLRRRLRIDEAASSERFTVFESVATFLGDLASDRPVLLVAEDLHWADLPTLALLRHLARRLGGRSILLTATFRTTDVDDGDELVRTLVAVRHDATTLEVGLRGLDREQVAGLLGDAHADRLDDVWTASSGNPFFVVELRRTLDEGRAGVPTTIRQSVGNRVDALPPASRQLISVAAVAGEEVDVEAVAVAAEVEPSVAGPAIARGLLGEVTEAPDRLRFVHALVRDAVLARLSSVERREVHRRIAGALEQRHGGGIEVPAALLAHHHRESGERSAGGSAYVWSMRAGQSASRSLAYEEAERELRAAIGIAGAAGDVAGRLAAELELAEVLQRSGRPAQGRELAVQAELNAAAAGEAELRAWAVFITRFGAALGIPTNLSAIREARASLPPGSAWGVPLDVLLAAEVMHAGDVDAGTALLDGHLASARATGDALALGLVLTGQHLYVDRVATSADEILRELAAVQHPTLPSLRLSPAALRVQTESLRLGELVARGDVSAARRAADDFVSRYGDESGTMEANVPLFRLTDALLRADWPDWRKIRDELRTDAELATAYETQLMGCEMIASWVRRGLGELGPLIESLPPTMMFVRPALAVAHAQAGRRAAAEAVIASCASDDGFETRARTVAGRAELALLAHAVARTGDRGHAARLLPLVEPRCGQMAAWAGWAFFGAFDHLAGLLAATCGQDAAVDHLWAALGVYEETGWRALAAATWADLAVTLTALTGPGSAAEARRCATTARRQAEELELMPVLRDLSTLGVS